MGIVGTPVKRTEDRVLLTSGGRYTADIPLDGAAHVTFVRSTIAHARIAAIEVEEALQAPGVLGVFTAHDLALPPIPSEVGMCNRAFAQPVLADDVVRFVGEPVAAVVTDDAYQGPDAAELVFVDYEPLPVVVDPEAARRDEVVLFPEVGTNVALEFAFGTNDALFEGCDVVVRQRIVNQRVAPCPLEVRAAAAQWGDDGRVTVWGPSQAPHDWRDQIARALDVEPGRVRYIAPDVGGGFGARINAYPEDVVLAWVARRIQRPARWVESRTESMLAMGHGRGQVQDIELGGRRDGTLLAYRLTVLQEAGAYPRLGTVLPFLTRQMVTGPYAIPAADFNSVSVVTNTTPVVAYRGAGRPEATAAIERAVDLFAVEIGVDPAEVRRRNLIAADAFPYTNPVGTVYDVGDYRVALDKALELAGYDELRAEQTRRREAGDRRALGVGVSAYVEITGHVPGPEFGAVTITTDGGAIVRAGTSSHGQGHATALAMIVSDETGIPLEAIRYVQSDTDVIPYGKGTMGSRSLQAGGSAVRQAALLVMERAAGLRTEHGLSSDASWSELAAVAGEGGLAAEVEYQAGTASFPYGVHVAVVEVDLDTGKVTLERMVAVDDAGRIVNPLLAEGQIHGGIAQGVAQALMEEVVYDDDGNPLTSTLADYAFISAAELPSFETAFTEIPTPSNELGAKGVGESGTIGATPALHNAVVDALAHLGVRHVDMPTTPERVWRAVNDCADAPPPDRGAAAAGTGSV